MLNSLHTVFIRCVLLTSVALSVAQAAVPQIYESGYGALDVFDGAGMALLPTWGFIWLLGLVATFAAGLFFVWRRPVARVAVAGFLLSMVVTPLLFRTLGLPFLGGAIAIGHLLFWTPALVLLLANRPFLDADENVLFRLWTAAMTFVILFSFVFDARDAWTYIAHFSGAG